jgi:Flp pilus assembly protein TadG
MRGTAPLRQREHHRRGALTVEVALIMPIFVVFLAGLLEFGHYYLVQHMLNAAARRGAHLGSLEGVTTNQVVQHVRSIVGVAVDPNKVSVSVKNGSVFDTAGVNPKTINYDALPNIELAAAQAADCFVVQARVAYNDVAVLPPFWIKNRTVTGRAVMRHE